MQAEVRTGPQIAQDGTISPARGGRTGEVSIAAAHATYYEPNYRGGVFSGGISALTSLASALFTVNTLGVTETPIAGVYNPSTSGKNLVLISATLSITVTAATATSPGPLVWATSIGNAAVSTGNTPLNRATLAKSGSVAKDMSNVALTGMTNNMVVQFGSALFGGNLKDISSVETAVGQNTGAGGISIEQFDGTLMVPPGGVLGLLSTIQAVAHSAVSSIVWEEVSI